MLSTSPSLLSLDEEDEGNPILKFEVGVLGGGLFALIADPTELTLVREVWLDDPDSIPDLADCGVPNQLTLFDKGDSGSEPARPILSEIDDEADPDPGVDLFTVAVAGDGTTGIGGFDDTFRKF